MMQETLTLIRTEEILPHPDNPRKNLGDLSELTESIKKNGIMQNLTVIPAEEGKYMALIGHRRLAAAKAAGLDMVPAKVVEGLSHREQVGIMLEENMQRTDLTIYEQAYGFQMMLDLGETEETIATKTGFSRTTVHHRLQIARLDRKILERQENDPEFQLTLKDLIYLEKVPEDKDRDHLLRTARNSADLRYKIDRFVENMNRKRNAQLYFKKMKEQGLREATEKEKEARYGSKWEHVDYISLNEPPKEEFRVKGIKATDTAVWMPIGEYDTGISIYKKAVKKSIEEKSAKEREKEEKERKRKELLKINGRLREDRKLFIKGLIDGAYGIPDDPKKAIADLAEAAILLNVRMYPQNIGEWITRKREYNQTPEQKEEVRERMEKMTTLHKLLILVDYAAGEHEIIRWDGGWYEDVSKEYAFYHKVLQEHWGFEIDDEEILKMLDGTHENYPA